MRRYLLNAAVIPPGGFGVYRYTEATPEELAEFLLEAPYISRIGYPETQKFIERITGVLPPISRKTYGMDPGDVAFVVRLKYRVGNARKKMLEKPSDEDFEIARLERIE